MDAETKEYLHTRLAEVLAALNAGFDRLAAPLEHSESSTESSQGELEDRVLSLEERLRTLKLELEFSDRRSTDLTTEMRSRLRLLETRMAAMERRLDSQEGFTRPPLRRPSSSFSAR